MTQKMWKNLTFSRYLHTSRCYFDSSKVENVKVTYELPDVLKKMDENWINRMTYIVKALEGKMDGIKGELNGMNSKIDGIKSEVNGLKGEMGGLGHKIGVYGALVGTVTGAFLKTIYDDLSKKNKS